MIHRASLNLKSFVGYDAEAAVYSAPDIVIGFETAHWVRNVLGHAGINETVETSVARAPDGSRLDYSAYSDGELTVVEIQAAPEDRRPFDLVYFFHLLIWA